MRRQLVNVTAGYLHCLFRQPTPKQSPNTPPTTPFNNPQATTEKTNTIPNNQNKLFKLFRFLSSPSPLPLLPPSLSVPSLASWCRPAFGVGPPCASGGTAVCPRLGGVFPRCLCAPSFCVALCPSVGASPAKDDSFTLQSGRRLDWKSCDS